MQPLVDGFNAVLARNAEVVERARTQAGNLAHALKTPLTVLENAVRMPAAGNDPALAALVREQARVARRHIDWHLARSRVAASANLPGQRTALERGVRLDETVPGTGLGLAIVRDLATMYGGALELEPADGGVLRSVLALPAVPSAGPA